MLARPDYIGTGRAHNCASKMGVFFDTLPRAPGGTNSIAEETQK